MTVSEKDVLYTAVIRRNVASLYDNYVMGFWGNHHK